MSDTTTQAAACIALLALLVGCGDEAGMRTIRETRRDPQANPPLGVEPAQRFGLEAPAPLFLYDVPEGFEELPPRRLREVNLRYGEAECYVSLLSGGGTLENVNRWRRQFGLPPYTAEQLRDLPTVRLLGREATLIDLEGDYAGMGAQIEGARMLAAHVSFPAFGVSVKLIGPKEAVDAARPGFLAFVRSLRINPERMGGAPARETGASAESSGQASPPLRWKTPEGWEETAGSSMRLVTFRSVEHPNVECWVTLLPGSAGGVLANANRWRAEMGLDPLGPDAAAALPRVEVGGRQGVLVDASGDYRGMGGGPVAGARLVGAIAQVPGGMLFVKMVGPADAVRAELDRFRALCSSLEWTR